jgi:hypothetical protein
LGRGFFDANHMPTVRLLVDARQSATVFGVLNLVSCCAGGVMVYVGGWGSDRGVGLHVVLMVAAGALLLAGLLLVLVSARAPTAVT